MPDYTADPEVVLPSPAAVVLDLISDGEDLDAAHLNPGPQQLGDYAASYIKYGAKLNAANIFTQPCDFEVTVDFERRVDFLGPTRFPNAGAIVGNVATQTITPNNGNEYTLPVASGAALPHGDILLHDTTPVPTNGDWIRLVIHADLSTFGATWRVKSESAGSTYLAHFDNQTNSNAELDARAASWIEFRYQSGAWVVWSAGPYWARG